MGKTSERIKVAIFVIVGTLLLVTGLYFVGQKQHLFSKNLTLFATFSDVGGLQLGNNVRYSGVNVGTVTAIKMIESGRITVEMSIEESTGKFIRRNATASIASDGLVGSMVINIVPAINKSAAVVVTGDEISTVKKVGTADMLSKLNSTNENLAILSTNLIKITDEILTGEGTVGSLMTDPVMANQLRNSIINLNRTTAGSNAAILKINNLISKIHYDDGAAATVLSDQKSAEQVKNVFSNLEQSSNEINIVSKNLNSYLHELKNGKGTINYLASDEELVQNIDSTIVSIKQASAKLDQNMEALRHNFLFRGYFNKLEREKKRELKKE